MLAGPVLVMLRSACGTRVLLSPLLFELGSDVPTGGVTLAVLIRFPVALATTKPVAVKVRVPPFKTSTFALIFPEPLAGQLEPALAAQVQLTPVMVAGKLSTTVAPIAALGPALLTTILYVICVPGMAVLEAGKSVLVKDRSAIGEPNEVLAWAVLLLALGSGVSVLTVAMLDTGSGVVYAPGTV